MYVETIRRGRDFVKVAKEVSKTKPIVAYYVGGSDSGKRAALSHTGALAGPDQLYDGIFKQCGVIRAASMAELFDFCWVLGTQPLPRHDRLAILSHSGGPGASVADAADRCGLKLEPFSETTRERLQPLVPPTASIDNPVDLTFNRNPQDYTTSLPSILLEDESVDCLFIYLLLLSHRVRQAFVETVGDEAQADAMANDFIVQQCKEVAELVPKYGKPVVGGAFCDQSELFVQELQKRGVPILPSPDRAVIALSALVRYGKYRESIAFV